jgi:hypothetical protein
MALRAALSTSETNLLKTPLSRFSVTDVVFSVRSIRCGPHLHSGGMLWIHNLAVNLASGARLEGVMMKSTVKQCHSAGQLMQASNLRLPLRLQSDGGAAHLLASCEGYMGLQPPAAQA